MEPAARSSFHWSECHEALDALAREGGFERDRRAFVRPGLRVTPPLVLPAPEGCATLAEYLDALPAEPGRQLVVLLQAGAASLGMFDGGEPLATKTIKKYVVRGRGRAQPAHLATKGKSRYGSRLRLQNARKLLEETNEHLREWWEELGPAELVFHSAPVRLWPELFQAKPPPPFERDGPLARIPLDLPRPTTEVLLRAYRSLCHGRIEREA
jgi:hypothetical protein